MGVDDITLNFNPTSLLILNIILGIVMFGVSLDLTVDDFKRVFKNPKGPIIGLIAQFLLLPAFTFLLTLVFSPVPSVAMGMILVSSCPGGNMSNFFANYSLGNTALSVSMTSISTVIAIFMTPFNIAFWGSLNEDTRGVLSEVNLNPFDMLLTIFIILGIPLTLGMLVAAKKPQLANKIKKPFKIGSIVFFVVFLLIAFSANFTNFLTYIKYVMLLVAVHNLVALGTGYFSAKLARLPEADRRAIAIEVGIQNSGLGLLLIFTFFDGLGGMALITAWWGVWHIVSGLILGTYWSKRIPKEKNQ